MITGTVTNAMQGTYTLDSTISYNGFVYMKAVSNSFYITDGTSSTSATAVTSSAEGTIITQQGQAISIKSSNYPLNRLYSSIYTFAITRPSFVVSTLQIDLPDLIKESASGILCGYQAYSPNYNYFDLMLVERTNTISCQTNGQKIILSGLTQQMYQLASNNFLFITVSGLLNPQTSVKKANFTFTFINTTSTYTQAVLLFTIPLSYTVSDPPTDIQIASILLSNDKFYANSFYTFVMTSVNNAQLTISRSSELGVIVHFPAEYGDIWSQIDTPTSFNMSIDSIDYVSTKVTLAKRYLMAVFHNNDFPNQIGFSAFNISFSFRNPNVDIDCSVLPIFTISLFDFKGKSIYA